MADFTVVASGLQFPEGPVAMPDGSVLVVEIRRGTLTRIWPDGSREVVACTGGGPNGAAFGPDGKLYVCNNGGLLWEQIGPLTLPGDQPPEYREGSIQRIDLGSGTVEDLYTECDGRPLRAPNDLVFDDGGGFWFTDHGKNRARDRDRTGVFYARADGTLIREVIFPLEAPNGVGLSPDGATLYVAETPTARVWSWRIRAPGDVVSDNPITPGGGRLLAASAEFQKFDSLAVDAAGNVCVATMMMNPGITVIAPDGSRIEHVALPDLLTTNICFGGEDLRTAYVTLSSTGRLVRMEWPRPGLKLHYTGSVL